MKRILTLVALICALSAGVSAESGLTFNQSTGTAVGTLFLSNGLTSSSKTDVVYVGTTSKPADESYYSMWVQGGLGILSTQTALSNTPVFAVHNSAGDDVFTVQENAVMALNVGAPVDHRLATFTGNKNDWVNIAVKNTNSGGSSSADVQAFNDQGNENFSYIDMGIQSSTFNDPAWSFAGPYDGYLFVQGPPLLPTGMHYGDLSIGTKSTGTSVNFFVGGTTSVDRQVTISTNGVVLSTGTALILADGTSIKKASDLSTPSSSTIITSYTTSQTSGLTCVTGSTITIVTQHPDSFFLSASGGLIKTGGGTGIVSSTFLVDSTYITGTSATTPLVSKTVPNNEQTTLDMSYFTSRIFPAGTHTACLILWTSTSNVGIASPGLINFGMISLRQ
jgi:hypothetical protein